MQEYSSKVKSLSKRKNCRKKLQLCLNIYLFINKPKILLTTMFQLHNSRLLLSRNFHKKNLASFQSASLKNHSHLRSSSTMSTLRFLELLTLQKSILSRGKIQYNLTVETSISLQRHQEKLLFRVHQIMAPLSSLSKGKLSISKISNSKISTRATTFHRTLMMHSP